MENIFDINVEEHKAVLSKMAVLNEDVNVVATLMADTVLAGGTIFLCGNGGSAADCQHIAAEFMGRFLLDRDPISSLALTTDTSALTCISNDYNYDDVFARQLVGLGKANDCLIGISTSGDSRNVLKAIGVGNSIGMSTVGLLGRDGGEIASLCKSNIIIPSNSTARVQEMHILIGHTLVGMVEELVTGAYS